jgi:hypothetical protein
MSRLTSRWSWLAWALALVGMMLPLTGWQASAQSRNLCLAGSSSDKGENESPGEEDAGDIESQVLILGSSRESLRPRLVAGTFEVFVVTGNSACSRRALHNDPETAAPSAVRLSLRC